MQNFKFWLIITLIIGLALGFLGGYTFKDLKAYNANPPTTETSSISDHLSKLSIAAEETVPRTLALWLINNNKDKKITQINPLINNEILTNIKLGLIPTANAQSSNPETCRGAEELYINGLMESVLLGTARDFIRETRCAEIRVDWDLEGSLFEQIRDGDGVSEYIANIEGTITKTIIPFDPETCDQQSPKIRKFTINK